MGSYFSKKGGESSSAATVSSNANLPIWMKMNSYEASLQANYVITSLATGEVTECLKQEVVEVIFDCKKDIWKSQELFDLVKEYFENNLKTLDIYTALEKWLERTREQLLIMVALHQFEDDEDNEIEELTEVGDPSTVISRVEEFQSVYRQQRVEPLPFFFL